MAVDEVRFLQPLFMFCPGISGVQAVPSGCIFGPLLLFPAWPAAWPLPHKASHCGSFPRHNTRIRKRTPAQAPARPLLAHSAPGMPPLR